MEEYLDEKSGRRPLRLLCDGRHIICADCAGKLYYEHGRTDCPICRQALFPPDFYTNDAYYGKTMRPLAKLILGSFFHIKPDAPLMSVTTEVTVDKKHVEFFDKVWNSNRPDIVEVAQESEEGIGDKEVSDGEQVLNDEGASDHEDSLNDMDTEMQEYVEDDTASETTTDDLLV